MAHDPLTLNSFITMEAMQSYSGNKTLQTILPSLSQIIVKAEWLPVTAISLLALTLRWWSPAMRSDLWYDELVSFTTARLPFAEMLQRLLLGGDANPPLYTFLLHFWLKLGDSDTHVKMLSLLFGISAIPMIYLLAERLFGRFAGLLSSLLLATSVTAISYSVQARCYSLLFFLSLLSTRLLLLIIQADRLPSPTSVSNWFCAAYATVMVLIIYTHWFGLLLLAVHFTALVLFSPVSKEVERQYLRLLMLIGLCCLPLATFLSPQLELRREAGGFLWPGRPGLHSLYDLAAFLFGGRVMLFLGVGIFALAYRDRKIQAFHKVRNHVLFFSVYLLLPVFVVFTLSHLLTHFTFFVFRYFLIFMAGIQVLLGLALASMKRKFAVAFAAAFILFPVIKFVKDWQNAETPYSQVASALPREPVEQGIILHLSPMSYFPVLHYSQRPAGDEKILWDPAKSSFLIKVNLGGGALVRSALIDGGSLNQYKEIWLVRDSVDQDRYGDDEWTNFCSRKRLRLESEKQFAGLRLEHYTAED